MSVIIGRARRRVAMDLKPAIAAMLYCSRLWAGEQAPRVTRKCAKIVVEFWGNYHPQRDASIYDPLRPPRRGLQHAPSPRHRRQGETRIDMFRDFGPSMRASFFNAYTEQRRPESWPELDE